MSIVLAKENVINKNFLEILHTQDSIFLLGKKVLKIILFGPCFNYYTSFHKSC